MPQTVVYFVRHGATGMPAGFYGKGSREMKLSDLGLRQAESCAGEILNQIPRNPGAEPEVVIYKSPTIRTRDTAGKIRDTLRNAGLKVSEYENEGIIEIDMGSWDGNTQAEIDKLAETDEQTRQSLIQYKTQTGYFEFPGKGEKMEEFQKRVVGAINKIVLENVGKTIIIVTHMCVIRALHIYAFFGKCDRESLNEMRLLGPNNTAISRYIVQAVGDGSELKLKYICEFLNRCSHIVELEQDPGKREGLSKESPMFEVLLKALKEASTFEERLKVLKEEQAIREQAIRERAKSEQPTYEQQLDRSLQGAAAIRRPISAPALTMSI